MRTFFITDIHGCNTRFKQVLQDANFDYDNDRLICGGDLVDRGRESYWVVEELLKIKNRIPVMGNHDWCFLEWMRTGRHGLHDYFPITEQSYLDGLSITNRRLTPDDIPQSHRDFFASQVDYYIDTENRMFCHAGYDRDVKVEEQGEAIFHWDHFLLEDAMESETDFMDINLFKRVFVGHRVTMNWKDSEGQYHTKPIYKHNIVACDTGAVFGGKLSLIDITDDENHILYQN